MRRSIDTLPYKLRDLIYAERRIELCFEGFRFWDIRRLNNTVLLGEDVLGIEISEDQSVFETMSVEPRNYVEYNIYGPIPYIETIKYDLIQNLGYE